MLFPSPTHTLAQCPCPSPRLPGPDRAFWVGPHTACTHHKQQLLHTLRHHVVKVAKMEVQGRPAHQLLLAQRAPVLGLHCMLGECMSPHLVRLWAQEAAVRTAVYLGAHGWWRGVSGKVGPTIPQPLGSRTQDNAPLPPNSGRPRQVLKAGSSFTSHGLGHRLRLGCSPAYLVPLPPSWPLFLSWVCPSLSLLLYSVLQLTA